MRVCCESWVLLGRGLCDGLSPRPDYSYRVWSVTESDQGQQYPLRLQRVGIDLSTIRERSESTIMATLSRSFGR